MVEVISNSPQETSAVGKLIAEHLNAGSIVALRGTLGSGKTCLTKGIALGLGLTENITSPTYTIINEYQLPSSGRWHEIRLYHIDAYRLTDDKDFEQTGGLEVIHSDGICVIEWSEIIEKSIPADAVNVFIQITDSSSRLIKIDGLGKI
jgi:tRNA threonylcarbamoyladenosine biosynthesis protein TsaE